MRFLGQTAWLVGFAVVTAPAAQARVDFRSEIQPVFEQHCYECHGPEERKGGLRLTSRAAALRPGDFGVPVITPSSAEASLLVDLISSDDPEERMPHDRDPLPAEKIELIRRWIDEGAAWPDGEDSGKHWAYVRPRRPEVPQPADRGWARNDIDRFVLSRLEREGLEPAPEAPPAALLRRVYFDLVGLPPSPEELDRFVAAPTDRAYEQIVEELLASPQFGERWAVQWLDAARYADSTGFMSEVELSNWPYRDWVIEAINRDMGFDDFTVEQLAGDLLPGATPEDRAATGFHRVAPLNLEAGVREEESRVTQVIDRVNTTASVWLGTTLECAQCHDHKYDPFTQEEYYRLFAFFNQTEKEAVSSDGMGGVDLIAHGPTVVLPHREETRQLSRSIAKDLLQEVERHLPETFPEAPTVTEEEREAVRSAAARMDYEGTLASAGSILLTRLSATEGPTWWWPWTRWWDDWVAETRARIEAGQPEWGTIEIQSFESDEDTTHRVLEDGSILLPDASPSWATQTIEFVPSVSRVTGFRIQALRHPSLPGGGPGRRSAARPDFVLSEVSVDEVDGETATPVPLGSALASASWPGGIPKMAIDGDPRTGWAYPIHVHQGDQWIVVVPRRPIEDAKGKVVRITLAELEGGRRTLGRFRVQVTDASPSIVTMPPSLRSSLVSSDWDSLGPLERSVLLSLAQHDVLPRYAPAFDQAREAFDRLPKRPIAQVMVERDEPRTTTVFERGDMHVPGKVVEPGTPAAFPSMAADLPRNRLGLARWLVTDENPITARVTVNRWWAQIFGRGIVATVGDFGVRGERPSHPELLDWLALQLEDSGWSRKKLLRQMVLSSTYRQGLIPANPSTLERDPDNRLLARSSRLRLPAETIRDNALQIAGLLSLRMGGPTVAPPQPPGVWRANGHQPAEYRPSSGEDRYRRGVYTVWRRTSPYPSFLNFDAPDRTKCVLKRAVSNTPMQALTLLNDEVYVEAALSFADRLLREEPDAPSRDRLRYAFWIAVSREPTEEELDVTSEILESRRARLRKDPEAATALFARSPTFEASRDVDTDELAAWFAVTRVLLNLDETIHRG